MQRCCIYKNIHIFDSLKKFTIYVNPKKTTHNGTIRFSRSRKNEIVIIGVEIDTEKIKSELKSCLLTNHELEKEDWKTGYNDDWPVVRVSPLK